MHSPQLAACFRSTALLPQYPAACCGDFYFHAMDAICRRFQGRFGFCPSATCSDALGYARMKRQQSSRDATGSRRRIRHSIRLAVLAALTACVPAGARAEPVPWQPLCNELSDFTKRLTDYRNEGKSLQEATAA